MSEIKRVFISYSYDSPEHREWVMMFATTIAKRGGDVVFDQWDLEPGQDLPSFMKQHTIYCDYVLAICTSNYVEKADKLKGGVGYEKMIMTSRMLEKIDANIIIPIVRETSQNPVPKFLNTRKYIDFSNDSQIDYALDELLRFL